MPTSLTRQVVVDDNDSRILYSSSFFVDSSGRKDHQGNFGATLDSTLHGTNSTGSFQFHFSGTTIDVFGTTDLRNTSGVIDPTWECFIDNVSIGAANPFYFVENNWNLCSAGNLSDTSHVVTVNAKSSGTTFWFDYFRYTPSMDISTEGELVLVENVDPDLHFDSSWQSIGPSANMTSTKGASVTFNFVGAGISFYGMIPRELPISPSLATYNIDDGPTTSFALTGLTPGSVTMYNQKFFETPTIPQGSHTLKVTFNGDDSSTPLVLDFLLVQNGTIAANTSAPLPTSTPPPNPAALTSTPKKVNVAGAVCGVLATIAFLLILAFLFTRYRKRKRLSFAPSSRFLGAIPFYRRPPPAPQETASLSTLGLFTPPPRPFVDLAAAPPVHHRRKSKAKQQPQASGSQPQHFSGPAPTIPPKALDDSASYYGGYQTWGQTKAQEAASRNPSRRPRDSHI